MNWTLIKEKYPNSYKTALGWFGDLKDIITWRHLYDFFDEQGIYVNINLSYTAGKEIWFEYEIDTFNEKTDCCSMDESDYDEPYKTKTRTLAEEQAFLKAFEILEGRL